MADKNCTLTAEQARAALDYDPETGIFTWKWRDDARKEWNTQYPGRVAGGLSKGGYRLVGVDGVRYYAHRLAILIVTGSWPEEEVDHIDGVRDNNAWKNLRQVSRAENCKNAARPKDNSTGVSGVTIHCGKYRARLKTSGQFINIGLYDTLVEASEARAAAIIKYGFHSNHGRTPVTRVTHHREIKT